MPVKVVIGLQWGDEGKGKVVDQLVHDWADVCVRYQGGANAGHTIYNEIGTKFVTHALPSGILKSSCKNIITTGCVINPITLFKEIDLFNVTYQNLYISSGCPLILPHHILLDKLKYQKKIGTTAKGIGPAYADYIARDNKTIGDLCVNLEDLRIYVYDQLQILSTSNKYSKEYFDSVFQEYLKENEFEITDLKTFIASYLDKLESLSLFYRDFVSNTSQLLQSLYWMNKKILIEGAQGWGLDVWGSSYPNVTSSSPNIGGVLTSTGLNHQQIDEVIGIVKLYKSKVGEGEHSTQEHFERNVAKRIEEVRSSLGEFGATTGRPRRLGWLNLDEITEACQTNGVNRIVITRLDSINDIIKKDNHFCVYSNADYQDHLAWLSMDHFERDDAFLNQHALLSFIDNVKKITKVDNISVSYGPRRNQLKW